KADMAKEAERLLDGTGWLPEPLRGSEAMGADTADADADGDEEALPAFLADDEDGSGEDETDEPAAVAAE
ncbi:hypothetical protein, partial [Staphylococcus aureus]